LAVIVFSARPASATGSLPFPWSRRGCAT